MKTMRSVAGSLMVVSGGWHGVLAFQAVENRPMLAFGIAYVIIGILLFLIKGWGVYLSALLLPVIGFVTASVKIGWHNFDFSLYTFVVIGVIVIVLSIILLFKTERKT